MFWAKWKFRNKEMENIKGVNLLGKCTYNSKYEKSFNRIDRSSIKYEKNSLESKTLGLIPNQKQASQERLSQ